MAHQPEQTPLTEQQARSLAHWWGGEYRQLAPSAGEHATRHGVQLNRRQADKEILFQVCSLEEARDMENRRGFQEAASPDWVG